MKEKTKMIYAVETPDGDVDMLLETQKVDTAGMSAYKARVSICMTRDDIMDMVNTLRERGLV